MANINRRCLQIKAIYCISHVPFIIFSIRYEWYVEFVINKSTKEVGGDITGTTIDDNNRKTKKIRWLEIRSVHLDKEAPFTMLYKCNLLVPWQTVDIGQEKVCTEKLQANCREKKFLDCKYKLIVTKYRQKIPSIMKNEFSVQVLISQ